MAIILSFSIKKIEKNNFSRENDINNYYYYKISHAQR